MSKGMQAHIHFPSLYFSFPHSFFLSTLLGPFSPTPLLSPPFLLSLTPDLLRNESPNHKPPYLRGSGGDGEGGDGGVEGDLEREMD